MIPLALGLGALGLLLWLARRFSMASVPGLHSLLRWVAALAAMSLLTMLLLTGRGLVALAMVVIMGPLAWGWWRQAAPTASPRSRSPQRMTRRMALEVLGLTDPVDEAQIRAAWVQAMQAAHPDRGGSDIDAARVNQAKDVLSGRK